MIPAVLYLWGGQLLIRTMGGVTGLATSEACCCVESGCFRCIDSANPEQWQVTLVPSFTGCWEGIAGFGTFALSAHPVYPNWCTASGSLPPACGYSQLGFVWTWEIDGTIRVQLLDTSATPSTVLCDLSASTYGCAVPFTDVTLAGACGTIVSTVSAV
jgi:hypothetical protein